MESLYVSGKSCLSTVQDSSKYSISKLNVDGDQLLKDTINDIITDPFNLIGGSQYGPQLILIAKCFLKNHALCDTKKLHAQLSKVCKAASCGDSRKSPSDQREKMWKGYHILCSDPDFIKEFISYLRPALSDQPCSTIFVQTLVRKLFEKIVLRKTTVPLHSEVPAETKITSIEENILRYAAGYVPFALRKQCMKTQCKNKDEKIQCLNAIGVCGEDDSQQSFLEYTKYWMEKQNRGGLFQLKNYAYLFFRTVEQHCRKNFRKERIQTITDASDIRLPVLNTVFKDNVAVEHWARATAGQNQLVSNQVMQMCVKLWVNIRGHAFATNWIENFKHAQTSEAKKKKSLRKGLKNIKL